VLLAAYFLETGKPERAGEVTNEALGIAPGNPAVQVLQGQVQLVTGRAADAARTFGALVERGVQTVDLYLRLAAAQAASGQIEPARASYRKALELSGDKHPGALLGLGRLEVAAGRPEAAREAAARLRAIAPDSALGPTLEGDALLAVGKLAEAASAYQEALTRGESSEVVLKLAQARRAAGDAEGGRQGLRDWVTRHPDDRAVRLALASALQLDGAVAEAVQEYEALITQQPTNAIALNNLAWLYYEARDPRALELAERAVKEAPENAAILDTAGWIQVQQGKMEQGLQLLRQASDRAPQAGEIRFHLGAALARTGDMAGARRELHAALATAGEQPWRAEAKRLLDLLP
jgi:putative PEP-CTERM system TPR-repeat lipoprotein